MLNMLNNMIQAVSDTTDLLLESDAGIIELCLLEKSIIVFHKSVDTAFHKIRCPEFQRA